MTIVIDGKPCVCEPGEYLLEIAKRNGIVIPTLCHHDGLPGQASCRICIVEVETSGRRDIVTACVYPVETECVVFTNSESVSEQRRMILSMLRSLAPESLEIERLCNEYGAPVYDRFISSHENAKCILCGSCTRACESLGTGAIAMAKRGILKTVTTPYSEPSLVCVGCASCAAVCPTGAIEVTEAGGRRRIWNKEFPIVTCKGCGAEMGTMMELWRATKKAGADKSPELCESCRKKAIADVMAATYGR